MSDMISRMDAIQACQVGPSDEWSRATKSGYSQAATDCQMNILRIPALPSVGVPETGEGKIGDRLDAAQWSAITAHFSYECEPRTTLPNWNTVAMEAIRLSNELREAKGRLAALDVQPAPYVAQIRAEALRLGYRLGFEASGEGYNGEYMIGSRDRTIEENEDWVATRDETLSALIPTPPAPSPDEHNDDYSIRQFTKLMVEKMALSRAKGRSGWTNPEKCSVDYLRTLLYEHLDKGDPVDVANFCMMLQHYGASTYREFCNCIPAPSPDVAALVEAGKLMLDAFCVHEDSHQIAAYEAMCSALAALARKGGA